MEDIINEIGNPVWWFSVIIAGFFISFSAGIANKYYEKYQIQKSKKKKEEFLKKQEEQENLVESLVNDWDLTVFSYLELLSKKQEQIKFQILGLIVMMVGLLVAVINKSSDILDTIIELTLFFTGTFLMFFSLKDRLAEEEDIIIEAKEKIKERID